MYAVDPIELARIVSWIATGVGVALWVWSWVAAKDPIQKLRLNDCAVVLVFSAILVRMVTQQREMSPIDWALAILSPLFVAAALWRLSRTNHPVEPK